MIEELVRNGEKEPVKHNLKKFGNSRAKKSVVRKFTDIFFEEDFKTVKEGLIHEVIIPTIKDFFADIFIGGLERAFYGGSKRGSSGYRQYSNNLVRNYSQPSWRGYYENKTTQPAIASKNERFSFSDVVLRDRASATDLLNELKNTIKEFKYVSVGDLYDCLDADEYIEHTDYDWGWKNLDDVQIKRVANGFWIDLPKPVQIR